MHICYLLFFTVCTKAWALIFLITLTLVAKLDMDIILILSFTFPPFYDYLYIKPPIKTITMRIPIIFIARLSKAVYIFILNLRRQSIASRTISAIIIYYLLQHNYCYIFFVNYSAKHILLMILLRSP